MISSVQKQYTSEMKKKFGYYATWYPGTAVKLGDIGIVQNKIFTRISDLASRNITFDIQEDKTPADLEYTSQGSVTISTKIAGTIPPQGSVLAQADAGLIIEFSKENATIFKAKNTTSPAIKDTIALGNKIIALYHAGKWNAHWTVITEIIQAPSASIIISNSSAGKLELKANAQINAAQLDIADAAFNFTSQFSKGVETTIIAAAGIVPLFKLMRLKTPLFWKPSFTPQGISSFDLITPFDAKELYAADISLGYV